MNEQTFKTVLAKMKKYMVETHLNKRFDELTTLGAGGKIKVTIYPDTVRKFVKCIRLFTRLKVEHYVLGKGSNVLASDNYYHGVVVVTTKISTICVHGVKICATMGASTLKVYKETEKRGLSGGEFLSCLPASIGGATVTNAGCFGQDMKQILQWVTVLHNGRVRRLSAKQCKLSKRNSLFKQQPDYTILKVRLKLKRSTEQQVKQTSQQMRTTKAQTQPLNFRSAGCMLYHDSVSISRLTDQAGLKGYGIGGARVSDKHAGFILNVDKASSKDIYLVMQHVERTLWERFGVVAKREICLVNFNEQDLK
ncbi:MAG: UDP-N-acetylmuramate dehydrogenase [Clostridiales bacterium]|nr:UDP-N-acetylmuramate dehydrogenase [Clostridiales bacterium]